MDVISSFAARYERTREEEMSLEDYLAECKRNPIAYSTAAAAAVALARRFAQRNGGVWYAFKDGIVSEPTWSIRLNGSATDARRAAPGIQ